MPIIEYKCMGCHAVSEQVCLSSSIPSVVPCYICGEDLAKKIMSTPAQIKMADMEKLNRRRQRIKEPMWRDLKTGKLTPANP
jgi:hypothetical protein